MKQCYICKQWIDEALFSKNAKSKDGLFSYCRQCSSEKTKKYRALKASDTERKIRGAKRAGDWNKDPANKERRSLTGRAYRQRVRLAAVEHYGGKCDCCGETRKEFLAIDHIDGGGGEHRRQIGGDIMQWLKNNDYPEGFRVLCHNCNASMGYYGYCPHDADLPPFLVDNRWIERRRAEWNT